MVAKTVKEVLVAARWIVDNVGWCQGAYYKTQSAMPGFDIEHATDVGCVCPLGSIHFVEVDSPNLRHRAADILNVVTNSTDVGAWNDAPGRTREEVLAMFDEAIERT